MESNKGARSKFVKDISEGESISKNIIFKNKDAKLSISYEINKEESQKDLKSSLPDNSKEGSNSQKIDKFEDSKGSLILEASSPPNLEGGEWNLLREKLFNWLKKQNLRQQSKKFFWALQIIVLIVIGIFLIGTYQSILRGVSLIPLGPSIFKIAGIIWLLNFYRINLFQKTDRQKLFSKLRKGLDFSRFTVKQNS